MRNHRRLTGPLCCAAILLSGVVAATAQTGQLVTNNTSKLVTAAKNLGPANQNQIINVSIWLKLPNRQGLDSLAKELYNSQSPQYRQWLSPAQIKAQFSPTNAQVAAVQQFFTSHGLQVTAVGPGNLYVSAKGTIAAVSGAFRVAIENYELNGNTYFANTSDPYVEGPAASSVAAVYGLTNLAYTHPLMTRAVPKQTPPNQFATPNADPSFFISNCFNTTGSETFTTNGSYPIATYKGNIYAADGGDVGCGYTPPELYQAYGLNKLYSEGFDGAGQTIVIIDWCGSLSIESDANAFSARFGLPKLNSSNFKIVYPSTTPTCAAPDPEINIDVEWAHAIAPGANIDLVEPPSASFQDVDFAEAYAVLNDLGNVISGSYGSEELYTPTNILETENLINELAAVAGISADFSSGDSGDFTFDIPGLTPSVSAPADSPYATAVGGITLALNASNAIQWQTGWGNNINYLVLSGYVYDPPNVSFFYAGSGGGPSGFFSKPMWQSNLPGNYRQLPDISWLADPYTGAVIAISEPLQSPPLIWTVYGGTSLACPMFSALWAIANEEAGYPLGQAAPYLYSMPASTITDIVPVSSGNDVTGTINQGGGVVDHYSASYLAQPLENTTRFISALWNIPLYQDETYLLTFGTDSGLTITKGWDNVTGNGVPNPTPFANYFGPSVP